MTLPAIAQAQMAFVSHTENDTGEARVESEDGEPDADAKLPKHQSFYDVTRKHPFAFEAQVAPFGSPIGWIGAAVDLSLLPAVGIYAGAGAGGSGVQWAVGLRPRLSVSEDTAFTATLAFSRGNFKSLDWEFTMRDRHMPADMGKTSWINVDVGPEYRANGGLLFRFSMGYSQAVASDSPPGTYYLGNFTPSSMPRLAYLALAVGVAP
jgi:hypothetical protein